MTRSFESRSPRPTQRCGQSLLRFFCRRSDRDTIAWTALLGRLLHVHSLSTGNWFMNPFSMSMVRCFSRCMSPVWCLHLLVFFVAPVALASADGPAAVNNDEDGDLPPSAKIEIPVEPQRVDPVALLPEKLAANVTLRFHERSLSEVAEWIEEEQGLHVFLDRRALNEAGFLTSEPISDSLSDDPLYLLLNRLRAAGLAWYLQDGNVFITTNDGLDEHLSTQQYSIGDLFDAGLHRDRFTDTLAGTVAPDSWEEIGGVGSYVLLGDVLFVRQTDPNQRRVAGLLAALRDHGRRTFISDASQNDVLRQKVDENLSIRIENAPLVEAIAKLSDAAGIPIRIDRSSLRESGIRERTPVTLKLTEQKLRTALFAILHELNATWIIRDGLIWIVSQADAETVTKTAVYDVRDLCRDFEESDSLAQAIASQASPDDWESLGGFGSMRFPRPGVLVVYQTERNHNDVLELLERYRLALRSSKPRDRAELDPKEVITRYYRMPTVIATDLRIKLPHLLRPETWRGEGQRDSPGTIMQVTSLPERLDGQRYNSGVKVSGNSEGAEPAVILNHSVLIIRQSREVHDEIPKILQRIKQGDADLEGLKNMTVGPGMGGMGGFGGGFF